MSREAQEPWDYTYIAAWGGYLGSHYHYIKDAQEKAAKDHAPADALYKREDGGWECRSDIAGSNTGLVDRLDKLARRKGD